MTKEADILAIESQINMEHAGEVVPRMFYRTSEVRGPLAGEHFIDARGGVEQARFDFNCRGGTGHEIVKWMDRYAYVFKDGNAFCAVREGFTNIQESTVGFGDTPDAAIRNLLAAERSKP